MTVPQTVRDNDVITCMSCEYQYLRSEAVCVICGTPVPAGKTLRASSAMLDEFSPVDEAAMADSNNQQKARRPGLRALIPIVAVATGLTFLASFLHEGRKTRSSSVSSPAPELTGRIGQPKPENTGSQQGVHYSARKTPLTRLTIPVSLITVQTTDAAKQVDPAYLWNAVKRGSIQAEIALANVYLKGEVVPQSCEQAHILLLAASTKGSKLADDALKGSYIARCR
jgi:hypothetical protein